MLKYIFIFIYLIINAYLLIFNWDLFTSYENVDFGYGVYSTMPYLILQAIGLAVLVVFAGYDAIKDLKKEVKITKLEKKIIEFELLLNKNESKTTFDSMEIETSA